MGNDEGYVEVNRVICSQPANIEGFQILRMWEIVWELRTRKKGFPYWRQSKLISASIVAWKQSPETFFVRLQVNGCFNMILGTTLQNNGDTHSETIFTAIKALDGVNRNNVTSPKTPNFCKTYC